MSSVGPYITAIDSPHLSAINTGLGNVLFQIASCYGLSKQAKKALDYRRVKDLSEILKARFGFDHGQTIFRFCNHVSSAPCIVQRDLTHNCLNERLVSFIQRAHHSVLIDGYLEYPPYFHSYRADILQLFSPDDASLRYIRETVPELNDSTSTPVSIHIRVQPDANTRVSDTYYQNAVSYILERIPDATFLVFSDGDPGDIGFSYRHVHLRHDYHELWAMTLCAHNIISASTFSWWGAYLNANPNKIVIAPRHALDYLGARNGVNKKQLQTDFFLDWECIP